MLLSGQMVDLPCQTVGLNLRSEGQTEQGLARGPTIPASDANLGALPTLATSLPHSLAAPQSRSHTPAASPTHLTFWAWRRAERGAIPPAPHSLNQAAAPPPYSPDHGTCHPTQGGHLLTLGQPRPFCRPENFPFLGFLGIPPPFQRPGANPSAVTPWA